MNLEEAKLKLSKYGQEQILRYFDELSDDEKAALLEQIDKTDMEVLSAIEHKSELVKKGEITPLDAMELSVICIYRYSSSFEKNLGCLFCSCQR